MREGKPHSPPAFLARLLVGLLLLVAACASALDQASARYKLSHDITSLEVISQHLKAGMTRKQVADLLGRPEYSPTEGQDYYRAAGSTRALVVDYRENEQPTGHVTKFELDVVGE